MICKNCEKEIFEVNMYCPNCGFKIEKEREATIQEEKPSDIQESSNDSNTIASSNNSNTVASSNMQSQQQGMPIYTYGTQVTDQGLNTLPHMAKKKSMVLSPLVIFLITFLGTLTIVGVIFTIIFINGVFKDDGDYTYTKGTKSNVIPSDKIKDNTKKTKYNLKYSYSELPDVVSMDSDSRFTFSANYTEDDVAVYIYLFNDVKASEAEFLFACDDYSILLQEESGFTYEEEFSKQQYKDTGELANYLTKESLSISIAPSIENSLYYAYISIFGVGEETKDDATEIISDMPNYDKFLADREIKYFTYDETVNMENGLSFYLYDVIIRNPGDGNTYIDITMDLSSYYSNYYMNNGDFMLLTYDADGNILSDAIPTSFITDSNDYNVSMPFHASASSYEEYTFTYIVPNNTYSFYIYASNVLNDDMTGPVYVMYIGY